MTGEVRCAGFVLAGGASSRFGRDKALVLLGGETLLARLCDLLLQINAAPVSVIGAAAKYGRVAGGIACVEDQWPGEGPLGGIITALQSRQDDASDLKWNLILGCDMPFLSRDWVEYLVQCAARSSAEVVVPQSPHGLEPLCACWRTSTRDVMEREFDRGTRRVTEAMKHLRVETLDATHWKRFDSAERLFWNMNTPADYQEAKKILEAEQF